MKEIVSIHEAKTHLSRLIRRALAGEEIVIAKGNKPLVKLVVLQDAVGVRKIGAAPNLIEYMSDDFDEPIEDMEEYME